MSSLFFGVVKIVLILSFWGQLSVGRLKIVDNSFENGEIAVNSLQKLFWNFFLVAKLRQLSRFELAEEFSGQFEGDIVIDSQQLRDISDSSLKFGLYNEKYHWVNGIVPYVITSSHFSRIQLFHNFSENQILNLFQTNFKRSTLSWQWETLKIWVAWNLLKELQRRTLYPLR